MPSEPLPETVRVGKLIDVSPPEDKEDGWLYGSGWSVTSPERLNGELAPLLTKAIVSDFQFHNVFKGLTEDSKGEALVLEGKIHRSEQRREQYIWTLCCGLLGFVLPFPLMKEEGEVDLELTLSREEGNPIRSYRGKVSFLKRCNAYEARCWQGYNTSPARYLDEAFGESVHQIHEAIRQDRNLIVH